MLGQVGPDEFEQAFTHARDERVYDDLRARLPLPGEQFGWGGEERVGLKEGVEQQVQEMMLRKKVMSMRCVGHTWPYP